MIKTLIFTDIHLHTFKQFGLDAITKLPKRLAEQQNVLEQILEVVETRKIERVIFVGDLFHKTGEIPVEALNVANVFFGQLKNRGVELFLVKGNHDIIDREDPQWFESVTNIFNGYSKLSENVKIIGFHETIDYAALKNYDLVVLHKTPIGSKVGNYEFNEGVDWQTLAKNNKLVMFGHIHQKQQLSKNCFVIGAPMHLNFGDIGERGVYILENDKLEFIQLKYPEFITVDTSDQVKQDGNYYRVLNADKKSEDTNVLNIVKPKYFEERLKSDTFEGLLGEWLHVNGKDDSYLGVIRDIVDTKLQLVKKIFKGIISEVRIKDFMSVQDISYVFKNGFIYVKGKNGGVKSNGAGKSTLFEAIYWCLYGKTTKGLTGDDVIRNRPTLQRDAVVEVVLKGNNNGKGLVKRSRKKGLEVYKNINDKDPMTQGLTQDRRQELLENLLGIPESLYLSACYFSQENLRMLTGMGDSDKTNLITNMLGFEQYDNLYQKCHTKQKDFGQSIQSIEEEIANTQNGISNIDGQMVVCNNNLGWLQGDDISLRKKIEECNSKIAEIQKEFKETNKKELQEIDYNKQLQELQENKKLIKESLLGNEQMVVEKNCDKKMEELQNKRGQLDGEGRTLRWNKQELEKEIENIQTLQIGVNCSKCGALITQENISKHIEEVNSEINSLSIKITKIQEESKNIHLMSNVVNGLKIVLNNEKSVLENKLNELVEKEQSIQEDKEIQNRVKENIKNQKMEVENQIGNLEVAIRGFDVQISDIQIKIQGALIALNKLTLDKRRGEDKIRELEGQIAKFEKDTEVLEFWKIAFSSTGIRSLLLDKFCNEFNSIVNSCIALISNGELGIILNPKQTIKSGEERNRLGLDILFNGQECKYESLSGGEKRRVDVALCLALNRWVSNKYSITGGLLGILILDELFSYVDGEGEESIANLLYKEGRDKAVVVISHTPSLEAFASDIWEVRKNSDITELIYNH